MIKMNNSTVLEYLFIIAGTTMLAFAINSLFEPNNLVVGGVTGIGIIVATYSMEYLNFAIPLWVTNLLCNIPLFIIAYKILGRDFLGRTVFATFYLSIALVYTSVIPTFQGDLTLAAIYGGIISGIGIGFVFRGVATTGGVDLAAAIIHRKNTHFAISKIMFIFDFFIILLGLYVFGIEKAMYAIIAVFVSSKCISTILEGMSFSKAAFIISDKFDEIAKLLLYEANVGVTALYGQGMYSGKDKKIILCVFSQKEITKIKKIVMEIDSNAFIMLTDFREVLGEGFNSIG